MWIAMRPAAPYMILSMLAPPLSSQPETSPPMQSKQSPCTRICTIDADTGRCAGCGRTLDEIARWSQMTDDERRRIISILSDRRRQARRAAGR
jgi:predicted Fe-S protein YdhL (DUF1289 family)